MDIISIIQIALSVILMITVLLQRRGNGLGSAFGGSDQVQSTRRGFEKTLFNGTVIVAILFIATAIIRLIA